MSSAPVCPACRHTLRVGARFCDQCGRPLAGPSNASDIIAPDGTRGTLGHTEKRQATVVNIDLVDSTRLTTNFGIEKGHVAIRKAMAASRAAIYRYKARDHANYDRTEGDSAMFSFGLPHASEDDAERAAAAALDAAAAVGRIQLLPGVPLSVRVGIATGEVAVETSPTELESSKPFITGYAANLAARLRELAGPGEVVVSNATALLANSEFDLVDLGERALKGMGTERAWRLTGHRDGNRLDRLLERHLGVPLVGRKAQIGTLRRLWSLARKGFGQVVILSGDAGIGKSRLLGEFYAQIRRECGAALHYQCAPYYQNSAYHPVIDHLRRWLSRGTDTQRGDLLATLRSRLVAKLGLSAHTAALVEGVLSTGDESRAWSADEAAARHKEMIDALIELARARVRLAGPSIMVLEDAQWADPSTLQIVETLVARVADWPVLVIVTHRPELTTPDWKGSPITRIALRILGPAQSAALIGKVAGGKRTLSAHAVSRIVERTGGNPLFLEELTTAVVDVPSLLDEFENDAHAPVVEGSPQWLVMLRKLVAARLDRSPHARTVAQVGAVIGREFGETLLRSVVSDPGTDWGRGLDELRAAGVLYTRPSSSTGGGTHVFKHALIQDMVLASMLPGEQRDLHGLVARALQALALGGRPAPAEIIAHHLCEAGLIESAVKYWIRAGEIASGRSTHVEAHRHYQRALAELKHLPQGEERTKYELESLLGVSRTLTASQGYGSPDVEPIYERLRDLSTPTLSDPAVFKLKWDEGQHLLVQAKYRRALEHCLHLAGEAAASSNEEAFAFATLLVGGAHLYLGQLTLARSHLALCAGLEADHPVNAPDLKTPALAYLARTVWFLGFPDLAIQYARMAEAVAKQSPNALHPAQAAGMRLLAHQLRGDVTETRTLIRKTMTLATDRRQPYWSLLATIVNQWLAIKANETRDVAPLTEAIGSYERTGARLGKTGFLALQADAQAHLGDCNAGLQTLASAFDFANATHEHYFLPELHRLHGSLVLAKGGRSARNDAEPSFRIAIDTAQRQGALSWQLRSAICLARLWADSGRRGEAGELLGAIHGRFSEGHASSDLQEAATLLAELRRP